MPPFAIKAVVSDVDGVLSDGKIRIHADGRESKAFHVKDGTGAALLRLVGIPVALLSGRESAPTTIRAKQLRVAACIQGSQDKAKALAEICVELEVDATEVAFIGDDLIDIPAMRACGFALAPADAHPLVREAAEHVTTARGGEGVLREVAELLLHAQGRFDEAVARYLGEDPP